MFPAESGLKKRSAAFLSCLALVWQYLNQHLSRYFIRAAHILVTIDIEPTTEPVCHPIFADKCLASDLHKGTEWEHGDRLSYRAAHKCSLLTPLRMDPDPFAPEQCCTP